LPLGWLRPWRPIAQWYSGQGSPYWAAKGMLGLALPAGPPAWPAPEQELPIDRGPFARVLHAPGWLAVGTSDGVVRVTNHGTDHRLEGTLEADGPLYAKLGYSTATTPVLHGPGVEEPVDGAVALLRGLRPSHRSGFVVGPVRQIDAETLIGSSRCVAHWPHERDYGEPDIGLWHPTTGADAGPEIDTVSVVRDGWEVRFVRVHGEGTTLRVGGWALTAEDLVEHDGTWASGARLATRVVPLSHPAQGAGVLWQDDVSPLAGRTAVPWVETAVRPGDWQAFGVLLGSPDGAPSLDGARITWPDGRTTEIDLDEASA
ncbi:MAG: DUF2264 domain-containing protein, partial [Microbacterium sp.]|nr:DUF2264 domain-containing protein [Microbacterium sp.]